MANDIMLMSYPIQIKPRKKAFSNNASESLCRVISFNPNLHSTSLGSSKDDVVAISEL
ncbi:hypothetical protein MtrunA17_Chr1g0180561 [Medicago truncatula]|uniref:Uncharacterized protein n=1 Tax=Medicago truncatula TaxID=3880 RepID=A0A396JU55_MEDTR|nr:hypothetical protein MtrunA17_Chr1g0180561 [Medicago truncatula]